MDQDSPFAKLQPFETPPASDRTWLAVGFDGPTPSLDPNQPPLLTIGLGAIRSDRVHIRIEGGLKLQALRLLPRADDVVSAVVGILKSMGQELEKYRNCACQKDAPCKEHKR